MMLKRIKLTYQNSVMALLLVAAATHSSESNELNHFSLLFEVVHFFKQVQDVSKPAAFCRHNAPQYAYLECIYEG